MRSSRLAKDDRICDRSSAGRLSSRDGSVVGLIWSAVFDVVREGHLKQNKALALLDTPLPLLLIFMTGEARHLAEESKEKEGSVQ